MEENAIKSVGNKIASLWVRRHDARRERHRALRAAFRASDSYGLLFILLLIKLFVVIGLPETPAWGLFAAIFEIATILLALHTSHASRRILYRTYVVCALLLIFSIGSLVTYLITGKEGTALPAAYTAVGSLLYVLVLLGVPWSILRRILGHEKVTVETILGALCVYLFLGFIFGALFLTVARFGDYNFALPADQNSPPSLIYLSFVTLTTVGFGDVVPNGNMARSFVILEALIGQVFLLTMLARLVSLYGKES